MIYFNINISATEQKIRNFVSDYNRSIFQDKKRTVKAAHLNTAFRIIKFYFKYAQELERTKQTGMFLVNNQMLATLNTYDVSTAYRHIQRLIAAGIIKEKMFKGSNTSYQLILNPEILVGNWNNVYSQELLKSCEKISDLTDDDRKKILAQCPIFAGDFCLPYIADCNDIATRTFQELNIKIDKVVCKQTHNNTGTNKQEHRNKNKKGCCSDFAAANLPGKNNNDKLIQYTKKVYADKENESFQQKVNFYVDILMTMVMNLLYKNKIFSEFTTDIVKNHLTTYFTGICENEKKVVETYNKLAIRLMIVRKWLIKAPGRFVPSPDVYFDPMFDKGFINTESWFVNYKKQQEINKEYYSNQRIFIRWWNEWNKRPAADVYHQATQELGKKKDKYFHDLFVKCVIDKNNINELNINN